MLRRTIKLKYVGLAAAAGFAGLLHINDYNLQAFGVVRTARAVATTASIAWDYKICGHTDQEWSATHKSAAEQLLTLCETNKGVYLKVGQHIGTQDNLLPAEYVQTLRRLNEVELKVPLADICQIIEQDLRQETTEIFDTIDAEPLHATVLAQVHHATLKGGREVAVKVQHPQLKSSAMIDIKTMELLAGVMGAVFGELKVEWLVTETKAILEQELNLLQQGKSASKIGELFRDIAWLRVPDIVWELSAPRVLVMEYISGARIDDVEQMKTHRFDLDDVTAKISNCFTTLMLKNGLIRADAIAPSDILVRKSDTTGTTEIVLMAHGLYEEVTTKLRTKYAKLQTLRHDNYNEVVTSVDRQVLRMQRTSSLIGDIQKAVYDTDSSFGALWIVTKSCVNFLYHDEFQSARTQWDRTRIAAAEKWTLIKLYASLFLKGLANFSLLATVRSVSGQLGLG